MYVYIMYIYTIYIYILLCKMDIFLHWRLARARLEDLEAAGRVRQRQVDELVDATRAHDCRVQHVRLNKYRRGGSREILIYMYIYINIYIYKHVYTYTHIYVYTYLIRVYRGGQVDELVDATRAHDCRVQHVQLNKYRRGAAVRYSHTESSSWIRLLYSYLRRRFICKGDTGTHAQRTDPRVALGA